MQHRAHKRQPQRFAPQDQGPTGQNHNRQQYQQLDGEAEEDHLTQRHRCPEQFGDRIPHRGDDAKAKHHGNTGHRFIGQHGEAFVVGLGYASGLLLNAQAREWRVFRRIANIPRGTVMRPTGSAPLGRARRVSRCTGLDPHGRSNGRRDPVRFAMCPKAGCLPAARCTARC